ncbi:MAG: cystathionine beta-synthase [Planctomycetota bacterium]
MRYYESILDLIGNTPLIRLKSLAKGLKPLILVKVEAFNPGGSVKDRIGINMIRAAEAEGRLKPGATIVEGTSGNTGMGLAIAASVLGYRTVFTIPDKMSQEKIDLLKAFGSEVRVCPTAVEPEHPDSYYSVAKRIQRETPGALYPNQYDNPHNPEAHFQSTGPEIWDDTDGKITHFVAGMGTGGTITGVGRYLRSKNPNVKIVGADPIGSLYYEKWKFDRVGQAHTYKVEGIGEDIFPTTMDLSLLDDVVQVTDKDCFLAARQLARQEGILAGGSCGAALHAGLTVAQNLGPDDVMVILLPDTGERYLSKIFNDAWMTENGFLTKPIELKATDIVGSKPAGVPALMSIQATATIGEAMHLMKSNEISQLPVVDGDQFVGSLSEGHVIQLLLEQSDAMTREVRAEMEEPLPLVEADSSIVEVSKLIKSGADAVLVRRSDGSHGIITKFDLLHSLE